MIVLAIVLVVVAIAAPNMMTQLKYVKWRGEVADLSGIVQACRSQAVKNNATEALTFAAPTGSRKQWVAYIYNLDDPGTAPNYSALQSGIDSQSVLSKQLQLWLFTTFSKVNAPTGTNPPPLDAVTMWGAAGLTPDTTDNICFNSRGVPCTCPASVPNPCTAITKGYAFYFTQSGGTQTSQWAAVGVSPAGRIKTFFWNGSAWAN